MMEHDRDRRILFARAHDHLKTLFGRTATSLFGGVACKMPVAVFAIVLQFLGHEIYVK